MTATPEQGEPGPDVVIGFNVHSLLYRGHKKQKELAFVLGLTPSVLSKKMRGESAWSARQVYLAADFLGVEPGRLFQVTVHKFGRNLSALPGTGSGKLPPWTPLVEVVRGNRTK